MEKISTKFGVQIATNQDGTYLAVNANIAEGLRFPLDPTVGSFMPLGLPEVSGSAFSSFSADGKRLVIGDLQANNQAGILYTYEFSESCNRIRLPPLVQRIDPTASIQAQLVPVNLDDGSQLLGARFLFSG